jgi:pyruvate dehydrogenase E2 component (dihydrolipoamide acetyltransferase)
VPAEKPREAPEPAEARQPAKPEAEPRRAGRRQLPPINEAGFSRAHASPSVRKLARELGVDLGRVDGSGRKGRVTADDVKAFVKEIMAGGGAAAAPALPSVPTVDFAKFGSITTEPLTRIQKISGPRLHASWVNIPHVTQHDEADITDLEETRQSLKSKAAERGIKLTPLAFVVRACVLALAEFPRFKSSLAADGENLVMKQYTHVGFAADTANGLIVPVIRDADKKDIYELAAILGELSGRAREGKLKTDDIQGGVFTISSLGGIGGTFFTPIIVAPEVAILGVSRNYWKPVLQGSTFVPRLMLPLSLSYDHRVIDGALAVRFTTRLCEILSRVDLLTEAIP